MCNAFINSLKKLKPKQSGVSPSDPFNDATHLPLISSLCNIGSMKLTRPVVSSSTPSHYLLTFACLLISLSFIGGKERKYYRNEVTYCNMTFSSISDKLALMFKSYSGKKFVNTIRNAHNPFLAAKTTASLPDSLLSRYVVFFKNIIIRMYNLHFFF
jgi:hypothetical protein